MRKFEEEKRLEELRASDDLKKGIVDPKAAKKPPPIVKATGKGGKDGDKPVFDIPKIEVPNIEEFTSKMKQKYLIERSLENITDNLLSLLPFNIEPNN
jgi:hypothetical protein